MELKEVLQIKISLNNSAPLIWRTILIEQKATFFALHYAIQGAMGWDCSHLYSFTYKGLEITDPESAFDEDVLDSTKTTLLEIFGKSKAKFLYEYDFGDDWEHTLKIEKYLPEDPKLKYPICIDGAMNCPPEDCGGIWGYYDLLEILKDKKHPDYEDTMEWMGEFDSTEFDVADNILNIKNAK